MESSEFNHAKMSSASGKNSTKRAMKSVCANAKTGAVSNAKRLRIFFLKTTYLSEAPTAGGQRPGQDVS